MLDIGAQLNMISQKSALI
jgi:hypothetical protein